MNTNAEPRPYGQATIPPAEIEFRWEVIPCYAGDAGSTLALSQGWEPFSVAYEPDSGRPVIWFRRRATGLTRAWSQPFVPGGPGDQGGPA